MGPTLPEGVSHHCLVKQATQASASVKYLLIGGMTKEETFSSKVWEYDWIHRQWSEMAPLHTGRHSHTCAVVNEGEFVIVAGGQGEQGLDSGQNGLKSVEMFEVKTSIWHKMAPLPHAIFGAQIAKLDPGAPYGSGPLAVVGGSLENPELLQFVRRNQFEVGNEATGRQLVRPRRYSAVIVANPRLVCY